MTVTTERTRRGARECRAAYHGDSNTAWSRGCRCPGAIEAHEQWKQNKAAQRLITRAAVVAGKACPAGRHNTLYAFETLGCRCSLAMAAYRRKYHGDHELAWRQWNRWRGPKTRVSRWNMLFVIDSLTAVATQQERLVAILVLERRRVPDGINRTRTLNSEEIAARLGISVASVHRLRQERKVWARQRPLRRQADAAWKEVRVRRAQGRAERERERHEAAHEAKRARRLFYARTRRRLERSRARARYH